MTCLLACSAFFDCVNILLQVYLKSHVWGVEFVLFVSSTQDKKLYRYQHTC